jgi:glycogen debranching enzyme
VRLSDACRDTLRGNDAGGYTVPTKGLYPFQWLWDSGFTALGWQTFDETRAWLELRTLMAAQWPDGMVPHIVHHRTNTGYTLDHTWWAAPGPVPSSGITQPPVLATAVRRMLERADDVALAERQARQLVPALQAFHRWLRVARDPAGSGLVAVLHPWEGGMDDSPVWDEPLARVPRRPLERPRPDTGHVDASQRPTDATYERYMALVAFLRERRYDSARSLPETPFAVAGVVVNAILARADRDLLALLERFDLPGGDEVRGWIASGDAAMAALWDDDAGCFFSRDLLSGAPIRVRTWEAFMPLFAGQATPDQAARMAADLEALAERSTYLLPSTHPDEGAFEARRYWRGPVWIPVNWLLSHGLRAYGYHELAARLEGDAAALVARSGLREYYDPHTGEGLGGGAFSWSAALLLDWQRDGRLP